jgi:hypothetical protein
MTYRRATFQATGSVSGTDLQREIVRLVESKGTIWQLAHALQLGVLSTKQAATAPCGTLLNATPWEVRLSSSDDELRIPSLGTIGPSAAQRTTFDEPIRMMVKRGHLLDSEANRHQFDGVQQFLSKSDAGTRRGTVLKTLPLVLMAGAIPALMFTDRTLRFGGRRVFELQSVGSHFGAAVVVVLTLLVLSVALLPAAIALRYDRIRAPERHLEIVRTIFRLDTTLITVADVEARYGDRLLVRANWGALCAATGFASITWSLFLREAISRISADPLIDASRWLAPAAALLGAYFAMVDTVLRDYVRGKAPVRDLGPYVIGGTMLGVGFYLLSELAIDGQNALFVSVAFVAGLVGQQIIAGSTTVVMRRLVQQDRRDVEALGSLDGLSTSDEIELRRAGITNVSSLVSASVIGLSIDSALPTPRLVDWIDQGILRLAIARSLDGGDLSLLRRFGIRTASDLLRSFDVEELAGYDKLRSVVGSNPSMNGVRNWRDHVSLTRTGQIRVLNETGSVQTAPLMV